MSKSKSATKVLSKAAQSHANSLEHVGNVSSTPPIDNFRSATNSQQQPSNDSNSNPKQSASPATKEGPAKKRRVRTGTYIILQISLTSKI